MELILDAQYINTVSVSPWSGFAISRSEGENSLNKYLYLYLYLTCQYLMYLIAENAKYLYLYLIQSTEVFEYLTNCT